MQSVIGEIVAADLHAAAIDVRAGEMSIYPKLVKGDGQPSTPTAHVQDVERGGLGGWVVRCGWWDEAVGNDADEELQGALGKAVKAELNV